eukprot:1333555-Prorocentrum_lima.AAC.1
MTSSLVGSEMCIRDRLLYMAGLNSRAHRVLPRIGWRCGVVRGVTLRLEPVSYTHLTLPTICSV